MDRYQKTDGVRNGTLRYDEVWKIPELSKIPVENGVSQNGLFGKTAVEVEIKGKESPGKILVGDDDVQKERQKYRKNWMRR